MKKYFLFSVCFYFLGTLLNAQIHPSALENIPAWNGNPTVATPIKGFTGVGLSGWVAYGRTCIDCATTHRIKIAQGAANYLQFPELTSLGRLKVYIMKGTSDNGAHEIILEKLMDQNTGTWGEVEKVSVETPSSSCYLLTFGENGDLSEGPITIRLRNVNSPGSLWLLSLVATAYGDDGSEGFPSYAIHNDMPKAGLGPIPHPTNAAPWQSDLLKIDPVGRLTYIPDNHGFVLPDFSHAGYKNGDEPIPNVPAVKTIRPVKGDNTKHIQDAINEVGAMPLVNGIRGALLLEKGLYHVIGPIYVNFEGVVLRGVGNDADTARSTVIYDIYKDPNAAAGRKVLVLGNKSNDNWDNGKNNEENIMDDIVSVGSFTVHINRNENYRIGDLVCIYHPCTEAWLQAVDYGDVVNSDGSSGTPWNTSTAPVYYHRYVKNIKHTGSVSEITLDAPVFYTLNTSLSQSKIYRFNRTAYRNIGIENLRVDIANEGIPDDYHAWDAVTFTNMENGWAKNVVALHFGQAGFVTTRSTRLTIENCCALDPVGTVTGGMGYNFNTYHRSQQILFKDCYARAGRHNFISNGASTTSGCVVYNCKSEGSRGSSEGHRMWTQAMLFDKYEDFNPITGESTTATSTLGFFCRMDMGSGHGWAMAHGVLWNCNVQTDRSTPEAIANSPKGARSVVYCEKPPTAQNYAIGCYTHNASDIRAYKKTAGYIEGSNKAGLQPASLYEAQLYARNLDVSLAITSQPEGGELCAGSGLELSVGVVAPDISQVTLQWKKDGVAIPDAIGNSYTLTQASLSDAGTYTVEVTDPSGTLVSDPASITVVEQLPDITFKDFPENVYRESTYHIEATGIIDENYPGIRYLWTYSGQDVVLTDPSSNPVEMIIGKKPDNGTLKVEVSRNACAPKRADKYVVIEQITGYRDQWVEQVKLYPNPAATEVCITSRQAMEHIKVTDISGRTVFSQPVDKGSNEYILSVASYKKGVYFVHVRTSSGAISYKMIRE